MCERKSGGGGSCGKFQYESPLRIHGRGKGAEEKGKNTEIIASIKNAFLLKTKPRLRKSGCGFLRQMASIDLSISHFGSSIMVMGFVKRYLKTQYKHKRNTLRS